MVVLSQFGWGLAALLAHLGTIAAALHLSRRPDPWTIQAISAALWGIAVVGVAVARPEGGQLWHSLSLLGFGIACLAFAYSAVAKSISLTMLRSAHRAGGVAPLAEVARRPVRRHFDSRIELLVGQGQVEVTGRAYRLSPKGRRLAQRIRAARRLFGIDTGAFYDAPGLVTRPSDREPSAS